MTKNIQKSGFRQIFKLQQKTDKNKIKNKIRKMWMKQTAVNKIQKENFQVIMAELNKSPNLQVSPMNTRGIQDFATCCCQSIQNAISSTDLYQSS